MCPPDPQRAHHRQMQRLHLTRCLPGSSCPFAPCSWPRAPPPVSSRLVTFSACSSSSHSVVLWFRGTCESRHFAVLAWRLRCPVALCPTAPLCFPTAACMVSAAASSYHSRHCPAAASSSTKGLVDPSASSLSLQLSLLLVWRPRRRPSLEDFCVLRRVQTGTTAWCLGPHEAVGVRTGGRLHPGLAGERLLKQRPKLAHDARRVA